MPVEVESSGQVSDVLRILRQRAAWILVPFAVITSLGTAFAIIVPKKYVCKTRIMVHDVTGGSAGTTEGREQGKVATHLIRSPRRIEAIIVQDLGWPYKQLSEGEQEDLVEKVLGNLSVDTPNMGLGVRQQVVSISYADTDRGRAFDFLNAVSARWRDDVLEKSRHALLAEFANLSDRKRQMEGRLTAIGVEVAEINRNNNIPPWTRDRRGERPLDPSFIRLEDARAELVELRNALSEAELDLATKRRRYELLDDTVLLSETQEGLDYSKEITDRQESIINLRLEVKSEGYKPTHSRYREIQDEIRSLEEGITLLQESSRAAGIGTEMIPNEEKWALADELETDELAVERQVQRISQLEHEMVNLEARTKELQSVYQQLEVLSAERVRINENLITVGEHHNDMRRDRDRSMSSAGDPFTVLDEPKLPVRPTKPDPLIIIVFSVLASLALGFGMALLLEFSKSCFRSVNDITRVMVVPVLGTVNKIVTRRDRRRALLGRGLIGGATLSLVVFVSFVTWAWANRPDLLTDDLRQSLDAFRRSFE
jgi:protein tyrosine kinase modulator